MDYDNRVEKFARTETPFNRHLKDRQKRMRHEFRRYGEPIAQIESTTARPFNQKNMELWTRYPCTPPTTLNHGELCDRFRPALIYGYFHQHGKIEGVSIAPATTELQDVHPTMALYALSSNDKNKALDPRNFSIYRLNNVQTITNSSQFFRVPAKPFDKDILFLSRWEALSFFSRRIHALLYSKVALRNSGNFNQRVFKNTVYEGPIFNLVPGEASQDLLLPDVNGRWKNQRARYPFDITQAEIDDLTKRVARRGPMPPTSLEDYLAVTQTGLDPFALTPKQGAAAVCRLSHLTSLQEGIAYGEAAYPEI
ncbi:MAG TPA: hypothetical protein DEA55_08085 [Rhodospirillaceae bacterium]|nr:hypothetical protein [Rhodospirillaceae bacterium]